MRLEAYADYVLGRPKIDLIEVKLITDANTLSANLLAGTVDVVQDIGSMDLALQLRDQWRTGRVIFNFGSDLWVHLVTQFVDPRPAEAGDPGVLAGGRLVVGGGERLGGRGGDGGPGLG